MGLIYGVDGPGNSLQRLDKLSHRRWMYRRHRDRHALVVGHGNMLLKHCHLISGNWLEKHQTDLSLNLLDGRKLRALAAYLLVVERNELLQAHPPMERITSIAGPEISGPTLTTPTLRAPNKPLPSGDSGRNRVVLATVVIVVYVAI